LRLSSSLAAAVFLFASSAGADEPAPRWWRIGPAGGAYGLFASGGATAGQYGFETFAAAAVDLGVSLRWFEASATGLFGSAFDSRFSGGAFLAHVAARIPFTYVAFTLGPSIGYVEVPGHPDVSGFAFEPVVLGVEIDPICHLRIGVLGAFGQVYSDGTYEGALRGALTIGYVMGRCVSR
jgi:hypothetical protein